MRRALLAFALVLVGLAAAALWPASAPAGVVVEDAEASDPGSAPLDLRIWYPAAPPRATRPLVVISHGTGGGKTGHADTAVALAQAGFVVVALTHTGDNFRDLGAVGRGVHLDQRPRHVMRTLDYMLGRWSQRTTIDPERIGMFGFSAGGFTALVLGGAEPDLSRGGAFCTARPQAWTCRYLRGRGYSIADLARRPPTRWLHDARVKAAVVAAPAIGYGFDRANLAAVRIPIQLWAAEHDEVVDDSGVTIRRDLPLAPEFHAVAGAGHFAFLEPCNGQMRVMITVLHWFGTEAICSDPGQFDRARFHAAFNADVVRFFQRTLPPIRP
ncbi:dienelactone hydrolase family protein [Novosphingobium sp. PS1R-30]|uniref:Dienelactone hydrolase family protein n=1 Tax=Novosphingobium anseongense TaxID=3133436 RepID=A0ABU8RYY0_9SPHN